MDSVQPIMDVAQLIGLWAAVVILMLIGAIGVVIPALPGTVFVFGGVFLGAWIDDFTRVPVWVVVTAGVLAVIAWIVDYVAAMLGAKRAGASKEAIIGAMIGTVAGLFSGFLLIGIFIFPLIGAAIGEYIAISDIRQAGNVGVATWIGLILGTITKLILTFFTIGMFIVALIF